LKDGKVGIIRALASINNISGTALRTKIHIPKSRIERRKDEMY